MIVNWSTGAVSALLGTSILRVSGLDDYDIGWFTAGKLTFTSGANALLAAEVKSHRTDAGGVVIELWQALPEPIAVDDVDAVRAALGYQRINLFGTSGGTRQAQLYMRRHGGSV